MSLEVTKKEFANQLKAYRADNRKISTTKLSLNRIYFFADGARVGVRTVGTWQLDCPLKPRK